MHGLEGGVNIHYDYDHEVARILRNGDHYKIRSYRGGYTTVESKVDVIRKLALILEPVDKRKLQIFYG